MEVLQVHQVTHSPSSVLQIISKCLNVVNHLVIALVAVLMTWISVKADAKPMTWHAWSCTIGFQVLMMEGILTFSPQNIWSAQYNTQTKRYIHWILQTFGSLLALSGIYVEYANYRGKHFDTKHSILGLISGILLLIGLLNGCCALWSVELRNLCRPVVLKCFHNVIGMTAIVAGNEMLMRHFPEKRVFTSVEFCDFVGIVSLYYGYDKKFMVRNANNNIQLALKVAAIVTVIFTLTGAVQSMYRQAKIIFF